MAPQDEVPERVAPYQRIVVSSAKQPSLERPGKPTKFEKAKISYHFLVPAKHYRNLIDPLRHQNEAKASQMHSKMQQNFMINNLYNNKHLLFGHQLNMVNRPMGVSGATNRQPRDKGRMKMTNKMWHLIPGE